MARRSRGGGFNNIISTAIVFVLLAAGVLSWVKVNNIDSLDSFYWHLRGWSDKSVECGKDGLEGLKNCDYLGESTTGKPNIPDLPDNSVIGDSNITISDPLVASQENTDSELSEMLASLSISEPQDVNYVRSDWKHWVGSPCNTRQDVLIAQGNDVEVGDKCKILSGTWVDPYSNNVFENSSDLDIDHLIPLGYTAKMGGNQWDKELKQQFANDKMHLLAVSAKENRSKGDKGPGSYMPPNKDFHCEYATIWIKTSYKYDLSITGKDRNALEKALKTC